MEDLDIQNPNFETNPREEEKRILNIRRNNLLQMMFEANDIEINRALTDEDTLRQRTDPETGEPIAYVAELTKVIANIEARLARLEKANEEVPDYHQEAA